MNKLALTLAALAALRLVALAAPVSITPGSLSYSQSFDSLGPASMAWSNDATIPGWYVQINNGLTATGDAQAADGTTVLSGLLNLGSAAAPDRALGSKATGTGNFANIAYAVSFQNNTGKPIGLTQLQYAGELWRTNSGTGTPVVAVDEDYAVFYQISGTAVTNILSGGTANPPVPGAGFTALGAGANWINPVNTPLATTTTGALDGNAAANRTVVTFTPSGVTVLPGQFLMIKWTDANESGTDGFQGIDDVTATFIELDGAITPSFSAVTRQDPPGTPADPTDDTFGFTVNVTGSGSAIGTGWTTTDANPPAGNAASGTYGTNVVWTGFPLTGSKNVTFSSNGSPVFSAGISVEVPRIIGTNELTGQPLTTNGTAVTGWAHDEVARSLTQNNSNQADHVVLSEAVDLSAVNATLFTAELDAVGGSSSGFEAADSFYLQLIIDGGAPVSVLGPADANNSGRLTGPTELPGIADTSTPFAFSYLIPASAGSVRVRITGNSNSPNETFVVKNIKLSVPPASLYAVPSGPVMINNNSTPDAADDTFSGPVDVTPVNPGASAGWNSNTPPPADGLYSGVNAVTVSFGPYPVSGGPRTITLSDKGNPAITAAPFTLTPPAATLAATAAANIARHENGPGLADDTITFDTVITGTNGGPGWTTTGATPASGIYGPVTFTVPAGAPSFVLTLTDVSYPAATRDLTVALPVRYTIGWRYNGTTLTDVFSDIATMPAVEWVNDPVLHTLDMSNGGTGDKIVSSDVLDLSTTGTVHFSALLRARETSVGSNFETGDLFKAELIIDGGLVPANIINLVSAWDSGDGASAVGAGGGPNGPPNGYINGYQGIAVAPATAIQDYNANKVRDEFNTRAGGETAETMINNTFALSAVIPAGANSVQLRIYGAGVASSEFFTVSQVLFSTVPPTADTDGDGVTDLRELVDGTDPHDSTSLFAITGVTPDAGNPGTSLASFTTAAGRLYQGYYSNDLVTWTRDDATPAVTGDGGAHVWPLVPEPAPGVRRYLKVLAGFSAADFPATLP